MTTADVILVIGITGLAYWRHEAVLYLVSALALLFHGFTWAADVSWAAGAPTIALGFLTIYRAAMVQFGGR